MKNLIYNFGFIGFFYMKIILGLMSSLIIYYAFVQLSKKKKIFYGNVINYKNAMNFIIMLYFIVVIGNIYTILIY
jgi:hypothetical protein